MVSKTVKTFLSSLAGFFLLLPLSLTLLSSPVSTHAASNDPTPLIVGMYEADYNAATGLANEGAAFEKDYLQAIAEYANWSYSYVVRDWDVLLNDLKVGNIDILLDVSKTEEREQSFDFSSEEMGTEMACLYARSDSGIHYEDFTAFNHLRIGYEKGSTTITDFTEYAHDNSFTFTTVPYNGGNAMSAALSAGEVDAVLETNFMGAPSDSVLVCKCKPNPIYFATNKAKPNLKISLDQAMATLFSYVPSFNSDLFNEHFGTSTSETLAFSQAEDAYRLQHPTIYFVYELNWAPFEYDQSGEAHGISPDVIRAIGEDTGINFQFVLTTSTEAIYHEVDGQSVDTIMAVSYNYTWANDHGLWVSQPYVSGGTMLVSKSGTQNPQSAATVKGGYLEAQITNKYPTLNRIEYETFDSCMKAIASGAVDCTFLNYYQANYYRSMSQYSSFSYSPNNTIQQSIGLGVSKSSNPVLLPILSKSLAHISSQLPSILSENSIYHEPLSLSNLIARYPTASIAIIIALVLLVFLVIFLFVYSSIRQKQNAALAAEKNRAEQADKAKSEFLSRMSHDIRTPLNGIIGLTYLAQEKNTSPEVGDDLKKIDTSSKFLLSLINDILDMSKAEASKIELHPEPYPIDGFKAYLAAVFVPLCEQRKLSFQENYNVLPDRIPVLDKLRTNQIVFNLLSNAVKFTNPGGAVSCTVNEQALEDGQVGIEIIVSDNGIGMSEEFQKSIFTPFTQEERALTQTDHPGTGLGMAITKKLVDVMGGTISVKSAVNKGSTFTVKLKTGSVSREEYEASHPKQSSEHERDLASLKGKRILVCEDNALNQQIIMALLKDKGMEPTLAANGKAGLEAFEKAKPFYFDAVLMDIRMPIMDGYAATKEIRSLLREDAKSTPILAMTADAFSEDVSKAIASGMDGHLAKPINPSLLYQTLASVIAKAQQAKA
jgi:signal transduction histidine kinase/CheY-like chemotaxis protein